MFKFSFYDPAMPEREVNEQNAIEIFDDILSNDDDKVVRKLMQEVSKHGTTLMKMGFLEIVLKHERAERERLMLAESIFQHHSIQRNVDFITTIRTSIERSILSDSMSN